MKKLLMATLVLGSLSSYAAELSCFISGEAALINKNFSELTTIRGENYLVKYSVFADEKEILRMSLTDVKTGVQAEFTGINSIGQAPSLVLTNSAGEAVFLDCILRQ